MRQRVDQRVAVGIAVAGKKTPAPRKVGHKGRDNDAWQNQAVEISGKKTVSVAAGRATCGVTNPRRHSRPAVTNDVRRATTANEESLVRLLARGVTFRVRLSTRAGGYRAPARPSR